MDFVQKLVTLWILRSSSESSSQTRLTPSKNSAISPWRKPAKSWAMPTDRSRSASPLTKVEKTLLEKSQNEECPRAVAFSKIWTLTILLQFLFILRINFRMNSKSVGLRYQLVKTKDWLLFRKFGCQHFYVYCPSFCGQIFEWTANLWAYFIS